MAGEVGSCIRSKEDHGSGQLVWLSKPTNGDALGNCIARSSRKAPIHLGEEAAGQQRVAADQLAPELHRDAPGHRFYPGLGRRIGDIAERSGARAD